MNKNPFYTNPKISKQFLTVLKNRLKFYIKYNSINVLFPENKHKLCFKKWKFECIKPKAIVEKKDRKIRMRTRIYIDNYALDYNYNHNFIKNLNKKDYDAYRRKELLSLIGNIKENKKIKEFEDEKKNYDNIKKVETKEHKINNDKNKKNINYNDLKIFETIEENYKEENEKDFMNNLKNYNNNKKNINYNDLKIFETIEKNYKEENEKNFMNNLKNYNKNKENIIENNENEIKKDENGIYTLQNINDNNKYKRWYDIPEDKRLKAWCFIKILSYVSYERLQRKLKEKYFFWKKLCGLQLNEDENKLHKNNY